MDFEKIYKEYFSDVYLYVRRLSGNEHIAEEITSDTFYKALSSINKFRGECDMRVWLCQIAKNCYFTYLKRNKLWDDINDREIQNIPDDTLSIEEEIIRNNEATHLKRILHTIPEPYREVFMWRVFAQLNFKEIGQIFNKSDNWACVTYHRARAMIKEEMEEKDNEK